MRKFFTVYLPFLVYAVCVTIAYFLFFYLLPKYTEVLAYFGFLVIYLYIYIGVFFFGYFMGKIIVKRIININIFQCLKYALISFIIMLLISFLKCYFSNNMYFNHFTFTFSDFIESLKDIDSMFLSIGTFVSFLIGELLEYMKIYSNNNKK